MAIIHAEGVFLWGVKRVGSIIHAEGVRVGVPSSAPKARVVAYRSRAIRWSLRRTCWK